MTFIVRLGFNPEFVMKRSADGEIVAEVLKAKLGELVVKELNANSLSFYPFLAEAPSAKECEDTIRAVWKECYPDNANALSILLVEHDGSEVAERLRGNLEFFSGVEEFQKIMVQLAKAYPLVKGKTSMQAFRAMNYLLAIDPGCGFRSLVSSFTYFLDAFRIFEKGENFFLTYVVGEEDKNGKTTVDSILNELKAEDNKYCIVGIDISYFLNGEKKELFREFLHALQPLQQDEVFVFRVPALSKKALDNIREQIEDMLELKTVSIEPYHDLNLMEVLQYEAYSRSFVVKGEVMDVGARMIHREKMDGRYYGFKTVKKVVNELIWEKVQHDADAHYEGKEFDPVTIGYDDIARLDPKVTSDRSGFDELSEMIGMEEIRKRIEEIVAQLMLAKKNEKMGKPSIHMRFVGAPGTGKTTVARIVGKIFKEKGLLRKGDFFEYEARSLCAEYVGQTSPKTHAICRDAYGSVLFIDEAYSLYMGDDGKDYGKEALTALISEMENHRDDMIVVMAGYTDEMSKLMEGNSGLQSRMPFVIEFKNYSRQQLGDIFMSMAQKHFSCEDGLEEMMREYLENIPESFYNAKEFSNARFVRNLYERTWAKAASRVAESGATEVVLTKDDFANATADKEFAKLEEKKRRIGF